MAYGYSFCDCWRIPSRSYYYGRSRNENHVCLPIFKSVTEIIKTFKSLFGIGGRCLKLRNACVVSEACSKVHNWISDQPASIKLGQLSNLSVIFQVVVNLSMGPNLPV